MYEAAASCKDIVRTPVTKSEPQCVTLAGYGYAVRHGTKVQLVTPYRVNLLHRYGVTVRGNVWTHHYCDNAVLVIKRMMTCLACTVESKGFLSRGILRGACWQKIGVNCYHSWSYAGDLSHCTNMILNYQLIDNISDLWYYNYQLMDNHIYLISRKNTITSQITSTNDKVSTYPVRTVTMLHLECHLLLVVRWCTTCSANMLQVIS